VLLIVLFILAPLIVVFASSLTNSGYLSFPPQGLSTRWYSAIPDNPKFIDSFVTSLELAVACVSVSVLVGVPAAYAIVRYPSRVTSVLEQVFLSPLMLPAVVFGLGFLFVLSAAGWRGTFLGALLAHVIIASPFVIRSTLPGLRDMDSRLEEASRSLGAGPLRTFFRVILPSILGSVIAGAVFAFIISFDEAVVTLFLVGPNFETLPVTIFTYVQYSNDPTVAAVSSVLVVFGVAVVAAVMRLTGGRDAK
jgi:putative spermidine/putrescine transport system permease protein